MGKQTCPKCHLEFEDSAQEKAERKAVPTMLRMIRVVGLEDAQKETKDCCYSCWKKEFRVLMKPFAEALGKNAEGW